MSKRKPSSPRMPDGLTPSEQAFYAAANRRLTLQQNGRSTELSALDAVIQKQMATALSGSPHAQRQFLENIKEVEARRAELIAEECAEWREIKADLQRELEAHLAEHGVEPLLFPHPDDIEIDRKEGVRIKGPVNIEEHREETRLRALVAAHLHQDALDRARTKRRGAKGVKKGDPFVLAVMFNKSLSPRFRMSEQEIIDMRMTLAGLSIRALLKLTHQAFKEAGEPRPRGAWAAPAERGAAALDIISDVIKLSDRMDPDDPRVDEEIMQILHHHLGNPGAA